MTTIDISDISVDRIPRDGRGRPLIIPPDGGKAKSYQRVSDFAEMLNDGYSLVNWKAVKALTGVARSFGHYEHWRALVAVHGDPWYATEESQKAAKDLLNECLALGGDKDRANLGSAYHLAAQAIDEGVRRVEDFPDAWHDDLRAYVAALAEEGLHVVPGTNEQFVVVDELGVAGSADKQVVDSAGVHYIADVKTGSRLSERSHAIQLACYAHGQLYDPADGARTPLGVDLSRGVVIHIPAGSGTCTLHEVDLEAGWEAAQLSVNVRQWRTRKGLVKAWTKSSHVITASGVGGCAKNAGSPAAAKRDGGAGGPSPATASTTSQTADECTASTATQPPTSSSTSSGEASTAAPTSSPVDDEQRASLQRRIDRVKENPEAAQQLATRWRLYDTPKWVDCTPDRYDDVDQLLADVEAIHGLPFDPPPQPEPLTPAPPERPVAVERDEGPDMEPADIAALRKAYDALPGEQKAFVDAMKRSANDAGVQIGLLARPSRWRFAITRMLLAWSAFDEELLRAGLALVLGDDAVQESLATGALFGLLDDEAVERLADVAARLSAGWLQEDVTADGVVRLRGMA